MIDFIALLVAIAGVGLSLRAVDRDIGSPPF